jgi:4-hydroxybenzoyl-CoA thioesterase
MITSRRVVQIEWGDCDPANIVFYPRYFAWFDASTANHFKVAGLPKPELVRQYGVVGFPMVDTGAKFFIPSSYGDEVTIETTITRFGKSSFDVGHRLMRGDELAVEAYEKRVMVKRRDGGTGIESCPILEEVKAIFNSKK